MPWIWSRPHRRDFVLDGGRYRKLEIIGFCFSSQFQALLWRHALPIRPEIDNRGLFAMHSETARAPRKALVLMLCGALICYDSTAGRVLPLSTPMMTGNVGRFSECPLQATPNFRLTFNTFRFRGPYRSVIPLFTLRWRC